MTGKHPCEDERQEGELTHQPIHCSIVIRAYNEEQHIGRLLTGISRQTLQNVEIILVDSGTGRHCQRPRVSSIS